MNYLDKVSNKQTINDSKNSNQSFITIKDGHQFLDQRIIDRNKTNRLPLISQSVDFDFKNKINFN